MALKQYHSMPLAFISLMEVGSAFQSVIRVDIFSMGMKFAKETYGCSVVVYVKDLECSEKFYKEILKTKTIFSYGEKTPNVDGTVNHIAFSVKNIESIVRNLQKKGIIFEEKEITCCKECFPNGSSWILFRGPDNERLELNEFE